MKKTKLLSLIMAIAMILAISAPFIASADDFTLPADGNVNVPVNLTGSITITAPSNITISANELPDYLPLFLEFLSTQPRQRARDLLGQTSHILAAIAARLEGRQSLYKAVFDALVAMARDAPAAGAVDELLKSDDDDPMDLTTLDAAWEEEEIRFGASSQQQACDRDSMIARLRHAKRAASSAPSP